MVYLPRFTIKINHSCIGKYTSPMDKYTSPMDGVGNGTGKFFRKGLDLEKLEKKKRRVVFF